MWEIRFLQKGISSLHLACICHWLTFSFALVLLLAFKGLQKSTTKRVKIAQKRENENVDQNADLKALETKPKFENVVFS